MFKTIGLSVFAFLAIFMFVASASAQLTIPGEVIDVIDGKTVLVAIPGGKVKVELQYIDVPDQGQQLSDTV
jgi:endonuclease YncB( thermonuclease family)